jgi:hypothetical protein
MIAAAGCAADFFIFILQLSLEWHSTCRLPVDSGALESFAVMEEFEVVTVIFQSSIVR